MPKNNSTTMQGTCASVLESCLCFSLRRFTREVRLRYDAKLQPVGLASSQFLCLLAICDEKCTTMFKLADKLGSDRTVLSRTLRPLEAELLVHVQSGEDRRTREISLTAKGKRKVEEAYPLWVEAQKELAQQIGEKRFESLLPQLAASLNSL